MTLEELKRLEKIKDDAFSPHSVTSDVESFLASVAAARAYRKALKEYEEQNEN